MAARTRIAPSPTGYFHVGTARNALYNWLVARQQGGQYVLRIEDTDAERNQEAWVDGIAAAMRWLDLEWDEYFRQSERSSLYAAAAERLHGAGQAYFCDCTKEAVDARKPEKAPPGYDGFCRDRGLEAGPGRALRFKTPREGATVVVDLVRGEPTFENRTIEDFVIQRSDGSPIFILANVVDDIDMRITHVIRSEEHLPNTPKYQLLWAALEGGDLPVFAHLPLLVNEKRQKISKRRDPVALEQYRDEGYLPEAMCNYLALLGWAPGGDREFVTRDELLADFRLEEVNNSPAFFDVKKLRHFNAEYIRRLPLDEFVARASAFLPEAWDRTVFAAVAELVQTRIEVLGDVAPLVESLFAVVDPDDASWEKGIAKLGAKGAEILDAAIAQYGDCVWNAGVLQELTGAIAEKVELNPGKVQAPLRVAVTGRTQGLPLYPLVEQLGRDEALSRLRRARERIGDQE